MLFSDQVGGLLIHLQVCMRRPAVWPHVLGLQLQLEARDLADAPRVHEIAAGGDDHAGVVPIGEADHLQGGGRGAISLQRT